MKDAFKNAYELFKNQKEWSDKTRAYAASELLNLMQFFYVQKVDLKMKCLYNLNLVLITQ